MQPSPMGLTLLDGGVLHPGTSSRFTLLTPKGTPSWELGREQGQGHGAVFPWGQWLEVPGGAKGGGLHQVNPQAAGHNFQQLLNGR